jgi:hypothetical protein
LIEIGSAFFSQYQMECYFLIKSGLSDKDWKVEYETPGSANWEKVLTRFVLDMAIQQESQRLGSFFPSDEAVTRAIEKIHILEKNDKSFGSLTRHLQIENRALVRTVATVLQVAAYRAGKVGEQDVAASSPKQRAWQEDLLLKFVIRYFDGSKTYQQIEPILDVKG